MPSYAIVDVVAETGSWLCPWPSDLLAACAARGGGSLLPKPMAVAYTVPEGFIAYVPVEKHGEMMWVRAFLRVERLLEQDPLCTLHRAIRTADFEAQGILSFDDGMWLCKPKPRSLDIQ